MESSQQSSTNVKITEMHYQIISSLSQYYKDRSKTQVWSKVFRVIEVYIGKQGTISSQSQKYMNFYLQNKSQTSNLGSLMGQNKQLICKIFDLCLLGADSIDQAISSGSLGQTAIKKLQKPLQQQGYSSPTVKVIVYCIQAVALHFCQFLIKFKLANGVNITLTNRRTPKIIKRKWLQCSTDQNFLRQIASQPISLLEGFIDNIKPILANYLNLETLFQVTSKNFWTKKAILSGIVLGQGGKTQFVAQIINLNRILDHSYTGRQMIQKKLSMITLQQQSKSNQGHYWSLVTCLSDIEHKILSIVEKLPIFLKPKSNGDILSYCRKQFLPTFKYQVAKAGYQQKAILTEYVQVFLNAGKSSFQILSFPHSLQVQQALAKGENYNIFQTIQKLDVKYSKVRVGPKSIAVVPCKNYYVLSSDKNIKNKDVLNEIIFWQTLPKYYDLVSRTLTTLQFKKKSLKGCFFLPIQHIFLDYLNHQYMKVKDMQLLKTLKQTLQKHLKKQQEIVYKYLAKNKTISLEHNPISYSQRFCSECKLSLFNYSCKIQNRKQHLCMNCSLSCDQDEKICEIFYFYNPKQLRYPLTLTGLYATKKKHPSQSIQNVYQKQICQGQFIGAIQNQNCKGQYKANLKNIVNCPIYSGKKQELFYSNRMKELKIITNEQILISIALKCPKSQQQRNQLIEKIKLHIKDVRQPDNLTKSICHRYDTKNMVCYLLWECVKRHNYT